MFKFAKRATSAVIAGAVVLGTLAVFPGANEGVYAAKLGDEGFTTDCGYNTTTDTNGTVNYSTVLGRATAYGVVADSWELLNHAETNFALNKFINTNNNVLEPDLAGTAPLSFVVGDIDGKLRFGNNTYEGANVKYVIHATEDLKSDYDLHQEEGYIHSDAKIFVDNKNDKVKLSVDTTYTSASASKMISHVATESANLATKATTIDIEKYEAAHQGLTLNEYVIDLDLEEYEGKAVYINVPKGTKLADIFSNDSAYSRSVLINKRSSTNVVFNFIGWETVYPKGPCVHITDKEIDYTKDNITYVSFEGKDYLVPKTTAGHYKNNTLVEEEIVDKVIFNMPDAKTVGVLEGGGAFLAPKAENSSVLSTSSGWIVVNGKFTNPNCEWHFLNGNRADSLYFSGQKKFTKSFTNHSAETPEIELYDDTTVEYDDGDFMFELYKSDSSFALGEKIDEAVVTKSGSFEFKPLKNLEEGETYYYVIKESSKSLTGITNNDGEIDIKVEVFEKDDYETGYKVTSYKYLTSEDKANNKPFRTNDAVTAQELEFYFGSVYNLITGSLKLKKTVEGKASSDSFNFYVQGEDGYWYDDQGKPYSNTEPCAIAVPADGEITINNLPVQKYTITEEDPVAKAGKSYEFNTESTTEAKDIEVKRGETAEAELINKYDYVTGNLIVEKTATDNNNEPVSGSFKFTVKDSDGKYLQSDEKTFGEDAYEFTIDSNASRTFEDLPLGTYTVTENTDDISVKGFTFTVTGSTTSGTGIVTKTETDDSTVSLVNKFTKDLGSLKVSKTATDNNNDAVGGTFKFSVMNSAGKFLQSDEKTFGEKAYMFEVAAGSSKTFADLPVGAYTVTEDETSVAVEGYTYATSGNTTSATETVVKDEIVEAKLVNNYTKDVGTLTVTKTATDNNNEAVAGTFKFTVKNSSNLYLQSDEKTFGEKAYEFSVASGSSKTFTGLPVGKYTVQENTASISVTGYTFTSTGSITSGEGTVSKTTTDDSTVALVNKFTKDVGTLTVKKTATDNNNEAVEGEFKFTVKNSVGKFLQVDKKTFADGAHEFSVKTGETVTFTGLPVDTYTVTENTASAAVTGYTYATSGNTTSVSRDVTKGATANAELINKYTRDVGSLTVKKTATDNNNEAVNGTFKFTVKNSSNLYLQSDEKTFGEKAYEFSVASGSSKTFTGLPTGTYTVEENTTAVVVPGYTYATTGNTTSVNASVEKNDTDTAELINKYTKDAVKGKLNVTKAVDTTNADGITLPTSYSFSVSNGTKWLKTDGSLSDTEVTYSVANGGTVNFVDVPEGTYTVTEKTPDTINGYSLEITYSGTAKIESSTDNKTVTITNTYTKDEVKGSLKVKKAVDTTGAAGITGVPTEFEFYVKDETGKYLTQNAGLTETETTYKVAAGSTFSFSNVPEGTYTATEVKPDAISGYTLEISYSDNGASIATSADDKTITITNTYSKEAVKGKLNVTKSVDITNADGITLPENYSFSVSNGTKWLKTDGSLSDTEVTYSVANGGTVNFVDVPEGTYTVTEVTPDTISGYDLVITYNNNGAEIAKSTDLKTITITNTYTKEAAKGLLKVKKVVDTTGAAGITGVPTEFEFYVKDETGKYLTQDAGLTEEKTSYKVAAGSTFNFTNVPEGTYTVTEAKPDSIMGYSLDISYTNNGASIASSADDKTITITNTYTKDAVKGKLNVTKSVDTTNADGITLPTSYTFSVSNGTKWLKTDGSLSDTEVTYTVAKGATVYFVDVPEGTYTVTEKTPDTISGYSLEITYTNNGASIASSSDVKTITITNTYKKDTTTEVKGKLNVTKSVDTTNADGITLPTNYTFSVSNGSKWLKTDGSLSDTKVTYTVTKDGTVNFVDVPEGTYTVTEETPDTINGYSLEITYTNNGAQIQSSTDEKTITITNTYKKDTTTEVKGKLNVTKSVDTTNADGITLPTNYTFSVSIGTQWLKTDGSLSDTKVTYTVTKDGTVNFVDVPEGTYTVTEETPDTINGYSLEITYTNNGAQIESSTDEKTITITNTYKKDTTTEVKGKLNVTKSVDTTNADGITLPSNYTFSVSNGSKWLKTDGSLSDTKVTYTVTKDGTVNFVDVPEGTYTVTEETPDTINGYSLEITYTNNGAQIESSTDEKTITITNTYKKDTTTEVKGKLNVTKSVDTTNADGITLPANYTFSVSNGSKWLKTDGSLSDTKVTYTVTKDGTVNFVDVPEGTYTVTEETPDTINGYSLEITYTNNGAQIQSSTDEKTITITNTYKKDTTTEVKGKLNVTKSVDTTNADGITLPANYTFSVSNGTKWLKTDGSLSDTKVTYTVAKDGTVNFVDVPEGTYTVTEEAPDAISNYTLEITYTNNGAQIQSSADEKTITITNTYKKEGTTPTETGELTVTKSVGGSIPSGFGSSYKFRVKCGDQYVQADGKLGNNAYEFTVDASSSTGTIITDLELGKTYVVEEVEVTGLPSGYTCSTTYTDSNKAVLDTNNKKASVKITNTFIDTNGTGDSGSLTVSKKVSGSTASSGMPSSYAFYIKCEDKYVQEDSSLGDDIFEFSVGPNKSFTINNLELDKEYEVVEVKVTGLPSGYSCETSYSNGGKVKLDSESDSGSVLITNTYSYKAPTPAPTTGKLKITKKLGENAPSSASSKVYSFTISGQGITKTVQVKAGKSVTVEDLKPGTYTVTENKETAAIPDYTLTVTGEGTASVEAGETAEKTITNTYKSSTTPGPQTGMLRLTKTIGGDAQEQDLENVTMCFVVKNETTGKYLMANGDFSDTEVAIKLTELDHTSDTMTWSKEFMVSLGNYTVTESNTTVYPKGSTTAYTFDDTSVTTATVEVTAESTADFPAKLELKNNYKKDSSTSSGFDVEISKQDVAHNAIADATLELRCVSGYDLSNVTVVKTSDGSPITYKLSQDKTMISFDTPENDSAIIKGLRAGEYELEETVIPKAFLKADTIKFTLRPDGSVEDSAGNVIVAGSPIIMIDKADPTYGQGHNTPVPATGEKTSTTTIAGLAILVLASACFTALVVYRKKKRA